ncbi:MAG: hypothetical protein L0211_15765 [Planctomycetaceae bacterium]|nr:hypothetical protein [Planctomycetaceae bacterium]
MRNMGWGIALLLLVPAISSIRGADDLPLAGETVIRLASLDEGQAAIAAQDDFVRSLSRFDLQCRLQRTDEPTVEDWRKFAVGEVRPWEGSQLAAATASVKRLAERLAKLNLPLPKTVLLVRTTGKEEGNAAYTRGAAIMLPDKVLAYRPDPLDRLLAHELFHVASRNNATLRSDMYAVVGFQTCPPIALPPSLAPRKITNPDAPLVDCYIELADGDKTYYGAPVLYASKREYDAKMGGNLFSYLTFRLLVIEKRDGAWQPVMMGDQPVVIDPKKVPAYYDKIGRNTQYVIHPDEILADNFVHLVMGNQNLATPRIVERMGRMLGRSE